MKTENALLTEIIEACFDLSMHGQVPPEQRADFLALGKRLRGTLVNLLTAEFIEGTAAVSEANRKISELNQALKQEAKALANIANTVEQIGQLVSTLDGLLKLAVGFK